MFKKICSAIVLSIMAFSSFLVAEIEYEIHDIGTLQTHSSQAIALNNEGQILGWYIINKSDTDKHFFLRNRDGSFHEIPTNEASSGLEINWYHLTDNGKVYGTFDVNSKATRAFYVWDQKNGVVKLGNISGHIQAINNSGQILIQSMEENENGKSIVHPIIWKNGEITKLNGLVGDLGIESDYAVGYAMNNFGEVVGYCTIFVSYKNEIYKQPRATKWVNGNPISIDRMISGISSHSAIGINDLGEILFGGGEFVNKDGKLIKFSNPGNINLNLNYLYHMNSSDTNVYHKNGTCVINHLIINNKLKNDSFWTGVSLGMVNDNGEIIAQGWNIYGERHATLLTPITSSN